PVVGVLYFGAVLLASVVGLLPGGFLRRSCRATAERLFFLVVRPMANQQVRNGPVPNGYRCRVILSRSGFLLEARQSDGTEAPTLLRAIQLSAAWAELAEVDATADHVYLIVSRKETIPVPRRAFADDDGFRRFVE